jgi:hypothetical protein
MPVSPVNRMEDEKEQLVKNGELRRRGKSGY